MNILLISGSDRTGSLNTQLLKYAENALSGKASVQVLQYADLPFYNGDQEFPAPESIRRIRQEVKQADALWFFCPEYNGNLTPLLINLIDWLSRPETPDLSFRSSLLKGKAYTISGIGGRGGARMAREKLSEMLRFLGMEGYSARDVSLVMSPAIFQTGSLESMPEARTAIDAQAEGFLAWLNSRKQA